VILPSHYQVADVFFPYGIFGYTTSKVYCLKMSDATLQTLWSLEYESTDYGSYVASPFQNGNDNNIIYSKFNL
jgi:hypothetical protein